ncbi:hypothetical protein JR316_0004196 [Psilocybe cubensis]|uniref:Uncharacterized protein n=2 Tax=Psilocybe cubensis TaxID=181762 RepID=A0A8H7XVI6_PSICU|nr:hypothetical protein JR316_0004196 [Psilocybe cubensis]KAH9482101.1 hypothetical protein JR316_0004196 [Psilocybe cubensis]
MAEKRKSDKVYPMFVKRTKPNAPEASHSNATESTTLDAVTSDKLLREFEQLLDFSSVGGGVEGEDEIATRLYRIARALLHEFRLVVRPPTKSGDEPPPEDVEFQILEAEFYLRLDGCHEDPFTHGSEEQKVSGRWYFHRAPRFSKDSTRSATSTTEYRGGSRKGLDLTFGGALAPQLPSSSGPTSASPSRAPAINNEPQRMGGILLRSIREVKSKKIISGPSLLVDRILAASGVGSIQELVHDSNNWAGNTSAFVFASPTEAKIDGADTPSNTPKSTALFLKPISTTSTAKADNVEADTIYYSPRIGLELSHPGTTNTKIHPLHPRIRFLPKRYRFFSRPHLLTVNGRAQTFLGVLHACVAAHPSGLDKLGLSRDVARLSGIKEATAAKYLADYMAGRDGGAALLDTFVGPKGKGVASSPASYLKMMGAISTLNL